MIISAVEDQRRAASALRDAVASSCSSPHFTCSIRCARLCVKTRERGRKKNSSRLSNFLWGVKVMSGVLQADLELSSKWFFLRKLHFPRGSSMNITCH